MSNELEDGEILDIRCAAHDDDEDYDGEPCERCHELIDRAKAEAEAAAAAKERASGAVMWAETAQVVVRLLPTEDLLRAEAEAYYRSRRLEARPGRRGLVAFARHNYTNYEELLACLKDEFPSVRGGEAYEVLRERVDAAVGDRLDWLASDEEGGEGVPQVGDDGDAGDGGGPSGAQARR